MIKPIEIIVDDILCAQLSKRDYYIVCSFIKGILKDKKKLEKNIELASKIMKQSTEHELNEITYKDKNHTICGSDVGELVEILTDILEGKKDEKIATESSR